MGRFTREELEQALRIVSSALSSCERAQPRFAQGTAQHTLLRNRMETLRISEALINDKDVTGIYTREELVEAVGPVSSIISKCEKALLVPAGRASHQTRLKNIVEAMQISRSLIMDEIGRKG